MNLKMKDKEIVLIEWLDTYGLQRWEYLDEIEPMPPCICYSVGFVLEDTPEYKTIALGLSETQVLGRTSIPLGCIKSVKKLMEKGQDDYLEIPMTDKEGR